MNKLVKRIKNLGIKDAVRLTLRDLGFNLMKPYIKFQYQIDSDTNQIEEIFADQVATFIETGS